VPICQYPKKLMYSGNVLNSWLFTTLLEVTPIIIQIFNCTTLNLHFTPLEVSHTSKILSLHFIYYPCNPPILQNSWYCSLLLCNSSKCPHFSFPLLIHALLCSNAWTLPNTNQPFPHSPNNPQNPSNLPYFYQSPILTPTLPCNDILQT